MDLAIISNGPSAELYPGSSQFNCVLGVNWTVEKWPVDWWCFCDLRTFADYVPMGNPGMFTKEIQAQKIRSQMIGKPHVRFTEATAAGQVLCHEDVDALQLPVGVVPWNSYSGPTALVLARHLGAKTITVWGADMTGKLDHTGKPGHSRTHCRWTRERALWDALVDALWAEGIEVRRVVIETRRIAE